MTSIGCPHWRLISFADRSGCVYALIGRQRHVLLATSEGQAAASPQT
jgi:hypothetical protein